MAAAKRVLQGRQRGRFSFGDLGPQTLAAQCEDTRFRSNALDEVFESDIRVNKDNQTWTTDPSASGCSNKYDVESTIAHERGHTLGMAHVAERTNGALTFSQASEGPCQKSERTLGKGDVLGLRQRY